MVPRYITNAYDIGHVVLWVSSLLVSLFTIKLILYCLYFVHMTAQRPLLCHFQGGPSKQAQAQLSGLFNSITSFFHPSNHGRWLVSHVLLLVDIYRTDETIKHLLFFISYGTFFFFRQKFNITNRRAPLTTFNHPLGSWFGVLFSFWMPILKKISTKLKNNSYHYSLVTIYRIFYVTWYLHTSEDCYHLISTTQNQTKMKAKNRLLPKLLLLAETFRIIQAICWLRWMLPYKWGKIARKQRKSSAF